MVAWTGRPCKGMKMWYIDRRSHAHTWCLMPWLVFGRLVGTTGKGIKAWHVDTKRMVSHMRLDPAFPDVQGVACSPTEPTFVCASSSSLASGARNCFLIHLPHALLASEGAPDLNNTAKWQDSAAMECVN